MSLTPSSISNHRMAPNDLLFADVPLRTYRPLLNHSSPRWKCCCSIELAHCSPI